MYLVENTIQMYREFRGKSPAKNKVSRMEVNSVSFLNASIVNNTKNQNGLVNSPKPCFSLLSFLLFGMVF